MLTPFRNLFLPQCHKLVTGLALNGADVQDPWQGMLKTVRLQPAPWSTKSSACQVEITVLAGTSCFNCSDWCYKRVYLVHFCLLFLHSRQCEIFAIIICDLCWGGIDSAWVCKGGMWNKLWEPLLQILVKSPKTVSREFHLEKRVYMGLTSYG